MPELFAVQLKLCALVDDKPVKLTVELPAAVHRDLAAYAAAWAAETRQPADLVKLTLPLWLIAPMLARFMATDRAFNRARRRAD